MRDDLGKSRIVLYKAEILLENTCSVYDVGISSITVYFKRHKNTIFLIKSHIVIGQILLNEGKFRSAQI